jgi:hypothetical protein
MTTVLICERGYFTNHYKLFYLLAIKLGTRKLIT